MIYLVITLALLLILSYGLNNGEYIAPSFVFTGMFLFSSIWVYMFEDKWNFQLHLNTYLLVVGAVGSFIIFCKMVDILFQKGKVKKFRNKTDDIHPINIEKYKLIIMLFVEILAAVLSMFYIMRLTGTNNISRAMYLFDYNAKYSKEKYELPSIIGILRTAALGAGYWFIPIFANNLVCRKRNKFPYIEGLIIIISMLSYMETGGRLGTINMFLGFVACYILILHRQRSRKYKKIERKLMLRVFVVFLIFIFSFRNLAAVVGRSNSFTLLDYLALYCGAPLANFDSFIQDNLRNTTLFGADTFIKAYEMIYKFLGINLPKFSQYNVYRRVMGFDMGNVYSCLKSYVYDFGYVGIFILIPIFASTLESVFNYARTSQYKKKHTFSLVLYSWLFNTIVFSFFAERFFELINIINVQWFIVWWFYYIFFYKIKLNL